MLGSSGAASRIIGRYQLFDEIASGGMATVHYGRMTGSAGFARTVAIKRLHPHFAKSPEFAAMLIDEARLAARIRHPNVVSTIDIVAEGDEMLLVMDYVQGVTLAHLLRGGSPIPVPIAVGIVTGSLYGLHSAHEATTEAGEPLDVVHRDVSPQNILIGVDGVPRVADFGIAKAAGRLQTTQDGQVKGKTAYMAPEQIRGRPVDRRTDVYAASVVLWEALSGHRLFTGESPAEVMNAVLEKRIPSLVQLRTDVPRELDAVVAKGLSRDPADRHASARVMAIALEEAVRPAGAREIGEWIERAAQSTLVARAQRIKNIEALASGATPSSGVVEIARGEVEVEVNTTTSSVVTDPAPPRHRKGRRAIAAVACSVVLAVAAAAWVFSARHPAASESASEPRASAPAPTMSTAPPAPIDSTAALTPAPSASTPPLNPTAPSAPRAPGAVSPRPSPRPRPPPAAMSGSHANCTPPYTIDTSGTRHWKDGC
jgi:serine/threonine-protein kinase